MPPGRDREVNRQVIDSTRRQHAALLRLFEVMVDVAGRTPGPGSNTNLATRDETRNP